MVYLAEQFLLAYHEFIMSERQTVESNFITTRVLVGLYPSIIIRDEAVQPIYKELLEYPEFDGYTSYSPPRPFMDNNTTLGTLTSSSNLLKVELSRGNLLISWTNVAHSATFAPVVDDVVELIARLYKTLARDFVGIAMLNEYVVKTDTKPEDKILTAARRHNLVNFATVLTYNRNIADFKDLDVNYTFSTVVNDADFAAAFKDHTYLLSANTSMPSDPDRIMTVEQLTSFTREVLTAQTGENILADISDGRE